MNDTRKDPSEREKEIQDRLNKTHLYDADPNCEHDVRMEWSGVKCRKCRGWFCY